jgi:hypothetical protein
VLCLTLNQSVRLVSVHSPALSPINSGRVFSCLPVRGKQDAALVYFDGRLAEAAVLLATAAKEARIPVSGQIWPSMVWSEAATPAAGNGGCGPPDCITTRLA